MQNFNIYLLSKSVYELVGKSLGNILLVIYFNYLLAFFFQFDVELRDGGGQTATGRATVYVYVTRNDFPPIFFQDVYNVTIDENTAIGSSIVTVSASDADPTVSDL